MSAAHVKNMNGDLYIHAMGEPGPSVHCSNRDKASQNLIKDTMSQRIDAVDPHDCEVGDDDAFYVVDMGDIYRQHLRWMKSLKRILPHYAIKCNPDPEVIRLLAALGTGFDCASAAEIEEVLSLGVEPHRIIYANPCKTPSHIRYAAQQAVKRTTFDNADELFKVKALFPAAELFLRLSTDDATATTPLSLKFGSPLHCTGELLHLAQDLGLAVVGISFHIGSGASDPHSFTKAVRDARTVFDQAACTGHCMRTLDIGGRFPSDARFEEMARTLAECLDVYFPSEKGVSVIGEPGRYYVESAFTLACNVIACREVREPVTGATSSYMLYLNDGIYGDFLNVVFEPWRLALWILRRGHTDDAYFTNDKDVDDDGRGKGVECSVWGPTCDGTDCISRSCRLPEVVRVGDWLVFERMGAYTSCLAIQFNGFESKRAVVRVSSERGTVAALGY